MSIIVLNFKRNSITGGQLYDSLFYDTIRKNSFHEIEFCDASIYPSGVNLKKILCPFIELKLFKRIKRKNICFFNSSSAYRHFLLLIMVRIFLPKVKVLVIHHHYENERFSGLKKKIFKFFELSFLKISTSVIIPSPYTKDKTKRLLPNKKIDYIEIPFKEKKEIYKGKDIKPGELLFIGTIEPRKGIHLLLDSLYLLKKENRYFKMNIIGEIIDDSYFQTLLDKISSYKLENEVLFHGRVSSNVLHEFLMTTELFVFPSLLEGYGMVLMEAMSYGIPIVAFNNSAMPYSIKDNFNGFLAVNKDVKDFKNMIVKILSSRFLRTSLSIGAKKTYDESRTETAFINDVKTFISTL